MELTQRLNREISKDRLLNGAILIALVILGLSLLSKSASPISQPVRADYELSKANAATITIPNTYEILPKIEVKTKTSPNLSVQPSTQIIPTTLTAPKTSQTSPNTQTSSIQQTQNTNRQTQTQLNNLVNNVLELLR